MTNDGTVQEMLGLRMPPIAIAFSEEPPAGVSPWQGAGQPAGCAFWLKAQEGASFYTVPSDHFGCAVGAYTHGIDLPPERASDLNDTIGLMVESGYLEMAEVPGIPRLRETPNFTSYGPADAVAFTPDVVLLTATPSQSMLIYEAALRAGAAVALTNLIGRPTCAVLPLTLSTETAAISLACSGNRIYTGLQNDEMYVSIPGVKWQAFKDALTQILAANARIAQFYEANKAKAAASA